MPPQNESGTPAEAKAPAPLEVHLPRGGSLTAWTDVGEARRWLTQASLVRINRSTDLVEPWLAESWTVSADNLVYTLKLRPNLRWSDGTALTADNVIASVASVPVMGKPLAARAIDPLTIEIRFPRPFAPGLRVLDWYPIRARHLEPDTAGLGPFVASGPAPAKAPAGKQIPGLRTRSKPSLLAARSRWIRPSLFR